MPLGPGEKLLLASRPVTAKFATIHCSKCHAWQKDGKCWFGDECKFAHEDSECLGPGSGVEAAAVSMPLLASDFCADHGTVVAQDAVVRSAASSGFDLATQVQYGTGSQRDARPEASF